MRQFIFTNTDGYYEEGYTDGSGVVRSCDSGLAVGDLVMESESISNGVDKVTSNSDKRSVIGYCIGKPTTTTAEILLAGEIDGLSGLIKGEKVYLGTDGTFTTTKPTKGYVHILGQAIEVSKIDFDPGNTKIKIYKPGFNFPLSYTNIVPANLPSNASIGNMDMDGNTLVIGSGKEKFYVFTYDSATKTWTQEAEISNPETSTDYFGIYVRISGNTIIASAHGFDANGYSNNGRTYIYTRSGTTWTLKTHVDGPNQDNSFSNDSFEVYNNIIVIGYAEEDYNGDTHRGVVRLYTFDGSSCTLEQTFIGDAAQYKLGAGGISIDGNRMIISAYYKQKVQIYDYNGTSWVLSTTLVGPNGGSFGYRASLNGNNLIIGANMLYDGAIHPGGMYIYNYDGSSWNGTLFYASDKQDYDYFGSYVSIYGDNAVVGAKYADPNGNYSGKAYIYEYNGTTWVESQIINGVAANDELGHYVLATDSHIFVSAIHSAITVNNGGEIRDYKNS